MSRTGLYDCHIFVDFVVDDFMRNSNFELHVKRHIDVLFAMPFLCSLRFLLFYLIRAYKEVST